MKKSLTSGEIAKYCDVNLRTVIRWIDKGSLKGYKLPGRGNNRVMREDFLAFLNENQMPIPDDLQPQGASILIVDDEPNVAKAIQRVVKRAGYQAQIATDGFQAGSMMASLQPQVMTLDLSMPGLDGFDVIKYTRSHEAYRHIKILVISALSQQDLDKALALGADLALHKPFKNEGLLGAIQTLLDGSVKSKAYA